MTEDCEFLLSRTEIMAFVESRLDEMAAKPMAWALTQESFVCQIDLLMEFAYLGTSISRRSMLLTAIAKIGNTGCVCPNQPLVDHDWARLIIVEARKLIASSQVDET